MPDYGQQYFIDDRLYYRGHRCPDICVRHPADLPLMVVKRNYPVRISLLQLIIMPWRR